MLCTKWMEKSFVINMSEWRYHIARVEALEGEEVIIEAGDAEMIVTEDATLPLEEDQGHLLAVEETVPQYQGHLRVVEETVPQYQGHLRVVEETVPQSAEEADLAALHQGSKTQLNMKEHKNVLSNHITTLKWPLISSFYGHFATTYPDFVVTSTTFIFNALSLVHGCSISTWHQQYTQTQCNTSLTGMRKDNCC